MSNSYRIRTKPGVDSSIRVLIDQEFEYLEILSLKIISLFKKNKSAFSRKAILISSLAFCEKLFGDVLLRI